MSTVNAKNTNAYRAAYRPMPGQRVSSQPVLPATGGFSAGVPFTGMPQPVPVSPQVNSEWKSRIYTDFNINIDAIPTKTNNYVQLHNSLQKCLPHHWPKVAGGLGKAQIPLPTQQALNAALVVSTIRRDPVAARVLIDMGAMLTKQDGRAIDRKDIFLINQEINSHSPGAKLGAAHAGNWRGLRSMLTSGSAWDTPSTPTPGSNWDTPSTPAPGSTWDTPSTPPWEPPVAPNPYSATSTPNPYSYTPEPYSPYSPYSPTNTWLNPSPSSWLNPSPYDWQNPNQSIGRTILIDIVKTAVTLLITNLIPPLRAALQMLVEKIGLHINRNLEGVNLAGANLVGTDMSRAKLLRANLQQADMQGGNFHATDFRNANLQGANLQGANLDDADLRGANLRGANLSNANLEGADLRGAHMEGAILEGAKMADVKHR